MRHRWFARFGLEAAGMLLVALVLLLTPFSVPSGWAAWAASGHVRPDDGAWDTLWRALWLRMSLGPAAARLLFAGTSALYMFLCVQCFAIRARVHFTRDWARWLALFLISFLLRERLALLIEGTRGMLGAGVLWLAWALPHRRARAAFAGLAAAAGPGPALAAVFFAWSADRRRTRMEAHEALAYTLGLGAALAARWVAFGDLASHDAWTQGLTVLDIAGRSVLCVLAATYAAKASARALSGRAERAKTVLRGAPAWVMGMFTLGAWWALFGAAIDAATAHDERDGAALVGAEYTGLPGAWVLHADGQSYARHLGAKAVGLAEPRTVHIAVYDPLGPGTDAELLELRRNVYFASIWPEDRVAALARSRPVYLASSPHMPANIVRYTLPERHLWRFYSEPRGATDRAAAMLLTQPWFPDPARRSDLLAEDEVVANTGSDRVDELRARVVFLLRTGDSSAKYVALNQLATAAPHDAFLSDLTHACQSASPLGAADVVSRKFASARAEAQTWRARFGE